MAVLNGLTRRREAERASVPVMKFNWKDVCWPVACPANCCRSAGNHYRNNAITWPKSSDTVTHRLTLANATITDMTKRQRDVAALDEKNTRRN